MKLYKFFFPELYNDKRPIPRKVINQLTWQIGKRFGGYSLQRDVSLPTIQGFWSNKRREYKEPMYLLELFTEDTFSNKEWIQAFKIMIKQQLEQKEIFILEQNAEII